jgi:hypothetical protein
MKNVKFIALILLCGLKLLLSAQQRFHVDQSGKAIQVDAFLIEWKSEDADTSKETFPIIWDAINTPQGVAGYIRYSNDDSCLLTDVKIFPDMNNMHTFMKFSYDTSIKGAGFYAYEKSYEDNKTSITTEWVIPWDSIPVDSLNQYEIGFILSNSCNEMTKPLTFYGKRAIVKKGRILTPKVIAQIVTIIILLLLFLRLKAKAKKLNLRRNKD